VAGERKTTFKPGKSGNPGGRPQGSRTKALVALDALAEGQATEIVSAMIDKAKDGDVQAGRAILERLWPPRKGRLITFDLPEVTDAAGLSESIGAITRQVADGVLTPDEATQIVGLMEAHRKAIETSELASRVSAIEERLAKR
jgi:hypothetical protein